MDGTVWPLHASHAVFPVHTTAELPSQQQLSMHCVAHTARQCELACMHMLIHEQIYWFSVILDIWWSLLVKEPPWSVHHRYTVLLYKFASLQSSTSVTQQLMVVQENTRAWVCNEQHLEAYAMSKPPSPHAMPLSTALKYMTLLNRRKIMGCS